MKLLSLQNIVLLLIGVALLATAGYAFVPQPIVSDVATLSRGALSVTVNEDGKTRIRERYVVSAPLPGRLLRVKLDPGDPVTAQETVLAVLQPTDPALLDPRQRAEALARVSAAQAAVKQAETQTKRAAVALNFAASEVRRKRGLAEKKAIASQEFEEAEMLLRTREEDVRAAEYATQIAQFELELAQSAMIRIEPATESNSAESSGESNAEGKATESRLPIRSPITGRVLRVHQESSAVVAAGAALLEIGDPTDLEVEIDVLSRDAVRIRPGARVFLEQWGGEEPLEGSVRLVEPSAFTKLSALGVEEQRVNVIVDFVGPLPQRSAIGDAYRVDARIVIWHQDDVLHVPTSALFRYREQWSVFVVRDGRARRQAVEIGQRNDLAAQILSGLDVGDQVVLHPSDKITDGSKIEPRAAP